jgi:hypothetical protein
MSSTSGPVIMRLSGANTFGGDQVARAVLVLVLATGSRICTGETTHKRCLRQRRSPLRSQRSPVDGRSARCATEPIGVPLLRLLANTGRWTGFGTSVQVC